MLTALGADPVLLTAHGSPAGPAAPRWVGPAPAGLEDGAEREEIAPGVWAVRHRRWLTPGDLDTAADIPETDDEDVVFRSPRYTPPDWQTKSLCARLPLQLSDVLFFGVEGRLAPEHLIIAVEAAQRICDACPAKRLCLKASLEGREEYGVWGGVSGRQRRKLLARIDAGEAVEDIVAEVMGETPPRVAGSKTIEP